MTSFTLGFLLPCVCNFSLPLLPSHPSLPLLPLYVVSLGLALHQFTISGGFYFSHGDVAGPFTTLLFGVTQTMAQVPGFLNPQLIAWIAEDVSIIT